MSFLEISPLRVDADFPLCQIEDRETVDWLGWSLSTEEALDVLRFYNKVTEEGPCKMRYGVVFSANGVSLPESKLEEAVLWLKCALGVERFDVLVDRWRNSR